MFEVTIDSRLRMQADQLPAALRQELQDEFSHANPVFYKTKAMGYWPADTEPRVINTWDENEDEFSLPRGGMARLRIALARHGIEHDEIDRRCAGNPSLKPYTGDWVTPQIIPPHRVTPWEHQGRMVDLLATKEQALIHAATGSGKTTALLHAIARIQLPTIIIVWDTKLLGQWQERIEREMGIPVQDIGLVQGQKRKLTPLTLAMQQTLSQMPIDALRRLALNYGVVAGDEIQRAAAKTYTYVYDAFPARYRIGVSADSKRKDGKHFLIRDLFGEVALEITPEEVVAAGHTVDVAVHMVPTEFDAPWYRELIDGKKDAAPDEPTANPDFKTLIDEITGDEKRNRLIAEFIGFHVKQYERRFLVFTHRVEHARVLDSLLTGLGVRSGRMVGGVENATEFEQTKAALIKGTKQAGVGTYQAIGVGQDIPQADAGFATTPIHNNRQMVGQVRGRMCRKPEGKSESILYYAYDRRLYGAAPVRAMMRYARDVRVQSDERPGLMIPAIDYLNERRAYETQHGDGNQGQLTGIFATAESRRSRRGAVGGAR